MDHEEKRHLRFACIELACGQSKLGEENKVIDLTADEVIIAAQKFYDFVIKQELN